VAVLGTDIALLLGGHDTDALVGLDATLVCLLNCFISAEETFLELNHYVSEDLIVSDPDE
jgi:hypothetical protein